MQKLFFISLFFLSACTYTKPVITEISQAENGAIHIEKCQIKYSPFWGISTENCTHHKA